MRTEFTNYEAKLQANIKESNLKKALAGSVNKELEYIMYERENNLTTPMGVRNHPSLYKSNVTMDVVEFLSDYIDWTYVSRYVAMSKKFINANIEKIDVLNMVSYNPHIDEGWVKDVLNGEENEIRSTVINHLYELFINGVIDIHILCKYGSKIQISNASKFYEEYKYTEFGFHIRWKWR